MSVNDRPTGRSNQVKRDGTFEILGLEEYRAYVILLNQFFNLVCDGCAIKAHHKELAELSVIYMSVLAA